VAPCRQPARCPVYSLGATPGVGKLLRDRGAISRRSKPASFGLAILLLSQPRPLGGLPRASPIAFRVSYFTPTLHLVGATTQRLIARLAQAMEFSTHCIGALRGAPASLHPLAATPQGLIACLYRRRGFPPITSLRFVAHRSVHTSRKPASAISFGVSIILAYNDGGQV
jgi:hypothetical protein